MKKPFASLKVLLTFLLISSCLQLFTLYGQEYRLNIDVYEAENAKCQISDGNMTFEHQFRFTNPPEGCPDVPVLSTFLILPEDWETNTNLISDLDTILKETHGFKPPVYPKVMDDETNCQLNPWEYINSMIYQSNKEYPEKKFELVSLGIMRGFHLGVLHVYPFRYKPDEEKTMQYHMKLTLTFSSPTEMLPIDTYGDLDPFARHLMNYDCLPSPLNTKAALSDLKSAGTEFLIITTDALEGAANRLATHRSDNGISTGVKVFTGFVNSNDIESFVDDCYANRNPAPRYVLLLGDVELLPASQEIPGKVSDLPYFDIEDEFPYIPDISYGRIPVATLEEAMTCVDKIIRYETIPAENPFYRRAALVSFFKSGSGNSGTECRRYIRTCEEIACLFRRRGIDYDRLYLSVEQFIQRYTCSPAYKIMDNEEEIINLPAEIRIPNESDTSFAWNKGPASVIESMNAGRFLTIHRGHGSESSWGADNYVQLNIGDVNTLQNTFYPTVVWSLNCLTGNFAGDEDCISEKLLKHNGGGAAGVFAAMDETETIYNDLLAHELVQCVWPEFKALINRQHRGPVDKGDKRMGDIVRISLTNLLLSEKHLGGYKDPGAVSQMLSYHWLGDPAMQLLPMVHCESNKYVDLQTVESGETSITNQAEEIDVARMIVKHGGIGKVFASGRIQFHSGFKVEKGGSFLANTSQECYDENELKYALERRHEEFAGNQSTTAEQPYGINIHPNPSTGSVTIEIPKIQHRALIQIYSMSGSLVYRNTTLTAKNPIDLSLLPKGIYVIRIVEDNHLCERKWVLR